MRNFIFKLCQILKYKEIINNTFEILLTLFKNYKNDEKYPFLHLNSEFSYVLYFQIIKLKMKTMCY